MSKYPKFVYLLCYSELVSQKKYPLVQYLLQMGEPEALVTDCITELLQGTAFFIYQCLSNVTDCVVMLCVPEFALVNQAHYQGLTVGFNF